MTTNPYAPFNDRPNMPKLNIEPIDGSSAAQEEDSAALARPDYATLIRELTLPKGWSVPLADVVGQRQIRLDAEHYDPIVIENNKRLQDLGFELAPLSDFAEVRLPSMFTRIWAKDKQFGLPYINATDLMSYFALGAPAQERFLSHASEVRMENLIIREGMILVTCSGTIGRVFDVPRVLDGCAGTHDIVRIIPHNPKQRGFLRAYLTSQLAQIQILSHTHGGQIEHATDEQGGSCLVPVLPEPAVRQISDLADEADTMRAEGLALSKTAAERLHEVLSNGA